MQYNKITSSANENDDHLYMLLQQLLNIHLNMTFRRCKKACSRRIQRHRKRVSARFIYKQDSKQFCFLYLPGLILDDYTSSVKWKKDSKREWVGSFAFCILSCVCIITPLRRSHPPALTIYPLGFDYNLSTSIN